MADGAVSGDGLVAGADDGTLVGTCAATMPPRIRIIATATRRLTRGLRC